MKYKWWIRITVISAIWVLLTSVVYMFMGMVILFGEPEGQKMLINFVSNEYNTNFINIMSIGCTIASSIIISVSINLSSYASKLDNLDFHISEYYKAKLRLTKKIEEL